MIELNIWNWKLITMCLLHDIKEDSWLLTWHNIKQIFGKEVKNGIVLLTKDELEPEYVPNLNKHGNIPTIMAKLLDRIHNMRTLLSCSIDKQKRKTIETRELYIPLAHELLKRLSNNKKNIGEYILQELTVLCKYYEKELNINMSAL